MKTAILGLLTLAACWNASAQLYDTNGANVQPFVGSGFYGYMDGQGQQTMFNNPKQVVADSSGNLFVLDAANLVIRKVTPGGTVSTFAGGGYATSGYGTNATVVYGGADNVFSMCIDHSGNLWVLNTTGTLVEITTNAFVTPISLSSSGMTFPKGMCIDSKNNIYISDSSANKIFIIPTVGPVSVFAGSGNVGAVDGNGIFTSFSAPTAMACDSADNIYVVDSYNHLIRRIDQSKNVTTIAGNLGNYAMVDGVGTNASFWQGSINGMCVDGTGDLILAGYSCIRKISPFRKVTTIAGSFTQNGYANGQGATALFYGASGVCVYNNVIYVADSQNEFIRQIAFYPQSQGVPPAKLAIAMYYVGITINGTVGRAYQIQTSPDMNTWTTAATVLLDSSPYLWLDHGGGPQRFYRAVMLP